jgi:polysaccharide export outer membrane protein
MKSLLAIVSLALLLSACSADRGLPLRSAQEVDRVRSANLGKDYLLAPNDEVALAVYGEPELSKTYKIGPDGNLEIPLIGKVPAAGQTIATVAAAVQSRLGSQFMQNPSVAGSIVTYRPFYILGEVNKPGQFPYSAGLTLEGAVALAQGYSYRAQMDYVFIQPEDQDEEVRVKVSPGLIVRPGDRIRVAERFF